MKRLLGILMAALLVVGLTGPAMAALFDDGQFISVVYETAGDKEVGTDLGAVSESVIPTGRVTGLFDPGFGGGVDDPWTAADSFADLKVGGFAGYLQDGQYFHAYFVSTKGSAPVVSGSQMSSFQSKSDLIELEYRTLLPGPAGIEDVVAGKATDRAYYRQMDLAGASEGSYGAFHSEPAFGEASLALLDTWSGSEIYVEFEVWHWSLDDYEGPSSLSDAELVGWFRVGRDASGDVFAELQYVPIPPSLLLLGSGLLGLIGIRRRRNS